MNIKESPLQRIPRSAKLLGGLALAGFAIGFGACNSRGNGEVREFFPNLPPSTPIPAANIPQFFQEIAPQSTSNDEGQDIVNLRKEVANRFGIELHTFDEISKAPIVKFLYGFDKLAPINWTEQNLNLLERVLSVLPKHLYKEREDGEKVHIILGPASSCGWDAKSLTPAYPREIMLSDSYFRADTPLSALRISAHEFGHLQTMDSCTTSLEDYPYFKKIEEILGGSFPEVRNKLLENLKEQEKQLGEKIRDDGRVPPIESINTLEEEQLFRLTRMKYGIAGDTPDEFIAVATESYVLGKAYFYRMFGQFFLPETVDNLYEFVNGEIFGGIEYPNYKYFHLSLLPY